MTWAAASREVFADAPLYIALAERSALDSEACFDGPGTPCRRGRMRHDGRRNRDLLR